ncbi:monocarboxylate transporter 12-like isoform X2 [Parambassis ranga]|uniref:Monocarboxylate transporter 12-like isoform X2 n=1 Tax=Parambassis ranga TaxID=210632 RepID=A0A6P7JQ63_9TELE|nr:monocarboxylate transporter 12-like isoform X2 [Parambassis ranga]
MCSSGQFPWEPAILQSHGDAGRSAVLHWSDPQLIRLQSGVSVHFYGHPHSSFPHLSPSVLFYPIKANFTSSSGSGIGTFLLAPAVQLIIEHYSWRGALLILGGFVSNLLVCGALMRPLVTRAEGRTLEYNVTNPAHKVTVLDSKPVSPDCSQVEPKQLGLNNMKETQGLCLANETFKNFGNNILSQGNVTLLPNPRLSDRGLKIAECILFSNKLTETVLGEIEFSDQLSNSSMTEELKVVESMKFNNEEADMFAQIEDLRFCEATPTDKTISPSPQTFVNKHTTSGGECFCLKSRQEFGFLMSSNFLILSVSFLFLAYGCSAPVVYLVPYALSVGVEHRHAAFLMSIFGVSGIVGNISFGWITDRQCLRRYRILSYAVAVTLEGLCCMSVPFLHSFSLLVPFCALYGYFDGAYVALIPVVTSDTVGSDYLTSALGVVYFLHAVPYLVSPPIGGWLVDQTGSYAATFFLSGASFIFSSVILAVYLLVRHSRKCNSAVRLNRTDTAAAAQQDII